MEPGRGLARSLRWRRTGQLTGQLRGFRRVLHRGGEAPVHADSSRQVAPRDVSHLLCKPEVTGSIPVRSISSRLSTPLFRRWVIQLWKSGHMNPIPCRRRRGSRRRVRRRKLTARSDSWCALHRSDALRGTANRRWSCKLASKTYPTLVPALASLTPDLCQICVRSRRPPWTSDDQRERPKPLSHPTMASSNPPKPSSD